MSRFMKGVLALLVLSFLIAVPPIRALWTDDGTPVCTQPGSQRNPMIVSDGLGGAIVAWEDFRSANNWDIYAQRLDATGAVRWAVDGIPVCTQPGIQYNSDMASDGAGGAIITWQDWRNANDFDIYAQRVDISGIVQWTTDGTPVTSANSDQENPAIIPDGTGGAIIAWEDFRMDNYDIYTQRLDASGTRSWWTGDVAICTRSYYQRYPELASDGAGGALITWTDASDQLTQTDIYVQRVSSAGGPLWITGGYPAVATMRDQEHSKIIPDGDSGAIVMWQDERNGTDYDIYAERLNRSGVAQWTTDGVAISTASGDQWIANMASDGADGAIITWQDHRGADTDIYAQRVDPTGVVKWTVDGVALCSAIGDQEAPVITPDGEGGAVIAWIDNRGGVDYDIYAQRVDSSGTVLWTADGVPICTALGNQEAVAIDTDCSSGGIVAWMDYRNGNDYNIYTQLVDRNGTLGPVAPVITSVLDIPGEEGGWVRITVDRAHIDEDVDPTGLMYNVWQRIDELPLGAGGSGLFSESSGRQVSRDRDLGATAVSSWPLKAINDRIFLRSRDLMESGSFPPGTWELLGSFASCNQDSYVYRASTLADSTSAGIPYSVYVVSIHTFSPSLWFASEPDSGYSVDNLPPQQPSGITGVPQLDPEGLMLTWDMNQENDFTHYEVYRGLSVHFVPAPHNQIGTPTIPECFDTLWNGSEAVVYKISSHDKHGNMSYYSVYNTDYQTEDDVPPAPGVDRLHQNFPNPFNPATTLRFELGEPAHVMLSIFDQAGRLVRVLVDERLSADTHEVTWDGLDDRDRPVASGVYFYRLKAGKFSETRKMVLLR